MKIYIVMWILKINDNLSFGYDIYLFCCMYMIFNFRIRKTIYQLKLHKNSIN